MKNKILHGVFLPPTIWGIIYLLYVLIKTFEKWWDWGWELTLFFHWIIFWVFIFIYWLIWWIMKYMRK